MKKRFLKVSSLILVFSILYGSFHGILPVNGADQKASRKSETDVSGGAPSYTEVSGAYDPADVYSGDGADQKASRKSETDVSGGAPSYTEVSGAYDPADVYSGERKRFPAADAVKQKDKITTVSEGYGSSVVQLSCGDMAEFEVIAPKDGLYYISVDYLCSSGVLSPELQLKVNGTVPFREMNRQVFENLWAYPKKRTLDRYGNEIVPVPEKQNVWQNKFISDASYYRSEPLAIPLKGGKNVLAFTVSEGELLIGSLYFEKKPKIPEYNPQKAGPGRAYIPVEAETPVYSNDSSIRAGSEYNADITPYGDKKVLNMLDAGSFKKAGQTVTYEFHVKSSGVYYLGFCYLQNSKNDFPVFLDIRLDGKIPNREMQAHPFPYVTHYSNYTVCDQKKEPVGIYLSSGKHTISLTISLDPLRKSIETIRSILSEIHELSLRITEISGGNTDEYRDFNLEAYLPDVKKQMENWSAELSRLYDDIKVFNPSAKKIGAFSSVYLMTKQLDTLAEKPNDLPKRMAAFSEGPSSVSQYLADLYENITVSNIGIDKLYFYQDSKDIPDHTGVFEKMFLGIKRFFLSFGKQSYSAAASDKAGNLQVWAAWPRQYVELMQLMADRSFTPTTGIKVDVSLMPDANKLVLANATGSAPDIATGINYTLPFELAIRGALADLTQFPSFKTVAKRFSPGLFIPATIENGIYSVPETMNFWTLYYRKDILKSLDLQVPETIDDVVSMLPTLRRRGKSFFYPTAGMVGMKTFPGTMPLIYQHGGSFYSETLGKTTLTGDKSLEGLESLTNLFTIYNCPYEVVSFYQNFRSGTMPLGIADYSMYNLLTNAAPEIADAWGMSECPGVKDSNGNIQRWTTGGAQSCVIFSSSGKQREAWEYLDWWTSAETQIEFGQTLQTTYGQEYIWNTANLAAFQDLPWSSEKKRVIAEQSKWITEVPRVPGTYMLERELSNIYNSIVLEGTNVRKAANEGSKRIDRETKRKLEEFGYLKDGKTVRKYTVPTLKHVEELIN